MTPRLVNSWSAVGLRFAFLALFATMSCVAGVLLDSAFAAFLLAAATLTASNVYLRERHAFKAFGHELERRSGHRWGKFQLGYFLIAGVVAGGISRQVEPLQAALLFAIPGGFCLAEVLAKLVADRTRLGSTK